MKLILIGAIFIFTSWTSLSAEFEFCFSDPLSMSDVNKFLGPYLLPSEVLQPTSKDCFSLLVKDDREELVTKLVRKEFPGGVKQKLGGKIDELGRGCEFVLEELSEQQSKENELFFGSYMNVNTKQLQNRNSRTSSLIASEGHRGSMTVGRMLVYFRCKKMSPTIEIEVSLDSQEGGLSTTLVLRAGEKREIGSVVQDLQKNKAVVATASGIELSELEESKHKKYLLSVRPLKER